MAFDKIFQGPPSGVAAGNSAEYAAFGVDSIASALYVSAGNGWVPSASGAGQAQVLNQTAASQASLLVYTAPKTGLYRVDTYAAQVGATGGTLPSTAVTYTEGETGATETSEQVQATHVSTNAGDHLAGSLIINAEAGKTITVSSASAATATYNLKARIEFLG
jgi:hypothetical protein